MIEGFLLPFVTIGLAELGDKTQLAILCLSSKTRKYLWLLLGAVLAFAAADGIAIILGSYITKLVPVEYIRIASGIAFVIFGILTLLDKTESEEACTLKNPFFSSFTLVFVSELGDKTQLSACVFALKYNPLLVFAGTMAALILLSAGTVFLGRILLKKVKKRTASVVAGAIFIIIGISCLVFR